jgi:integrase
MRKTLTARLCDTLSCPATRSRIEYRDTVMLGLGLRVTATGRKTFSVRTRSKGRQVRYPIGVYPLITLAEARDQARSIIRDVQLGRYEPPEEHKVLTLGEVVPEFIAKHVMVKNRDQQATPGCLKRFELLYERPLGEIKRADVLKVLDAIMGEGKPYRANRALAAIKKLFAWCRDRGYIEHHPIDRLKAPGKEIARDRILSDCELASLWTIAEDAGYPFGPAIQLLALTAQRRGEVTTMRWSDIDFARAIWTVPAAVAKNGRVHEVPLSRPVLDILMSLPRFVGSDLVFTTTGATPISGFGRVKERLHAAMGASDWRFHDLRRTAASGMARIGIAPHVIEKVLNHQSGVISGVAAVYNRHGYEAEKREALERWASTLHGLLGTKPSPRQSKTSPNSNSSQNDLGAGALKSLQPTSTKRLLPQNRNARDVSHTRTQGPS